VLTDLVSALQISASFRNAYAAATAAMIDIDERLRMPRPLLNLGRGPTFTRRSSVVQSARERAAPTSIGMPLWPAMRRNLADASRSAVAVQRTIISPSLTTV
jgi:hypothetical protein